MPPKVKPIGRSLSQGTLQKVCMSGDQFTTQKRIFAQSDERYRYLSQDTDIIIADSLQQVNFPNALCKSTTIFPTAQTVVNATVFLQIQQELHHMQRKIIPVGHSTAVSINPDTGKTGETLTHRHPNYYTQKCFLFTHHPQSIWAFWWRAC